MIAAFVDPTVLVSAFIGPPDAAPGRLVSAWREERFAVVVCPLLLCELAKVLARPKFARWAAQDRGTAYVAAFAARSVSHPDPTIQRRPFAIPTTTISSRRHEPRTPTS